MSTTTKTVVLGFLGGLASLALLAALLFGFAGRWDLPMFWAYLGVWAISMLFGIAIVDRGLIRERMRPGPGGKDYVTAYLLAPLWLGQCIIAALDVGRYHWSDNVPWVVQMISLFAMCASAGVTVWAEAVNRFFSPVIRIQTERGHHVISSGPYRYIRHPGYAGGIVLFASGGLVLGSWLAGLIGIAIVVPVLIRTAREDRILHHQLEGYAAYAQTVRYRLFPGVW
jgi:protein-S-isoprenylcysteine O-methyltransferase Ste14